MASAQTPFDDRDGWIWKDGKMLPWREAEVHVLTHAMHYASSVFEGQRAYNGEIFKLAEHSERLRKSAALLGFELPWSAEEINATLREAAGGDLKGILAFSDEQLVSIDFNHDANSSIVDTTYTRSVDPHMHKVLAWYDNEWGYSNRILDLVALVARVKKESLTAS